jgi:hypothetical protein
VIGGASRISGKGIRMNPPSLQEVQRWVKARVRPAATPLRGERPVVLNLQRGVLGEARLAVYAEGYLARMREALAETYEAVRHVLGETAFRELARAYAQRHPSHEYNLSLAGRHLPEFLQEAEWTSRLPFLLDLARLEWLVQRAFHAFHEPARDLAALADQPTEAWERLRIVFQPSVGLIASDWPVLDLWRARTQDRATINIPLAGRPQRVLVFRRGEQVRCELLEPAQFDLLEALLAGAALGEACERLARSGGSPPVSAWFARWAGEGLIAKILLKK